MHLVLYQCASDFLAEDEERAALGGLAEEGVTEEKNDGSTPLDAFRKEATGVGQLALGESTGLLGDAYPSAQTADIIVCGTRWRDAMVNRNGGEVVDS